MRTLAAAVLALLATPALAQPEGTLVVLNKLDDTAQIISLPSGDTVATLPTGRGPHEAAVSADGRFAVAANYENPEGPTLTVYDLRAREVARTIDLSPSRAPHGLAFVPGSGLLAVSCEGTRHLVLVDVERGEVEARIDTGGDVSHMVAVTPDGSRAFLPNMRGNDVSAVDLETRSLLDLVEAGVEAEGIDITPDGGEVWVTNRAEHSITVIDAASLEVVAKVQCPGFPIRCKATPDGERVLVSCAQAGELAVFGRESREELGRIAVLPEGGEPGLGPIGVLVTPDGAHAIVANSSHNEVVVVDLGSLEVVQRIETGRVPDGLAFTPAGKAPTDAPVAR